MTSIYRQRDIKCDRCLHYETANIVENVYGYDHCKCLNCGWVSTHPQR